MSSCPNGITSLNYSYRLFHPLSLALALSWGVEPLLIQPIDHAEEMFTNVLNTVVDRDCVKKGNKVVITSAVPVGQSGTTSLIKVHSIGQPITA
jgi:pyruvate kinase